MAVSFLGAGTVTSNTTAITPPLPTGFTYQAGDLNIGVGASVGNEVFTLPTGWAHFLNAPVNLDTTVRLTVMYRRWQAGDTALSWGDPGNQRRRVHLGLPRRSGHRESVGCDRSGYGVGG